LTLYFAADDDAIAGVVAKNAPVHEIHLHELSDDEFQATIVQPMRRLGANETYRQVHLRGYLSACITASCLPTTLDTIELADIYVSGDKRHSHILFNYGDAATALVIIAQHDPDNCDSVLGHRFVSTAESCYVS
jgi:hypothetical protein